MLTTSSRLPVLFIGHGSPLNVISNNAFTQSLKRWGRNLPLPAAILVISAHWCTQGTFITSAAQPEQIYDFYGFPAALYRIKYPCVGATDLAQAIVARHPWIQPDFQWGIDHAAWSVLLHLFPTAPVPVLELSLDLLRTPAEHYDLARELAWLREHGVLMIGSGNIVHNLRQVDFENPDAAPPAWAFEFDTAVKRVLLENQHHALINYPDWGQPVQLAVPTSEHFLPLLYVAALQSPTDTLTWIYEGFQNGSISMRGLQFS